MADMRNVAKREYRVHRAGEALRLGIYLNAASAATLCHIHEALDIAEREAPPGGGRFETAFVQTFIYFVKSILLRNWVAGGLPDGQPISLRGNKADDMLIALAKKHSCPLISNEGRTPMGVDETNRLRKRALAEGIKLLMPEQFYRGRLPEAEVWRFMRQFSSRGIAHHQGRPDYEHAQSALKQIHNFYSYLLEQTAPKRTKKRRPSQKSRCRG